jgi:hypothetical protein
MFDRAASGYNPHSRSCTAAPRFSPTRFIPPLLLRRCRQDLIASNLWGIKRYTLGCLMEDQTSHSPSDNNSKPRRAWVAGIANFAAPLGHFYVGRPLRGVVLALTMTLVSIGALLISLRPLGRITIVLIVLMLLIGYLVPIVDAAILARRKGKEYTPKWYNRWYMYLLIFGIVALLGGIVKSVVRAHLVQAYKLPSGSMIPTLLVGDHILVDKTVYKSQ